MKEFAYIRYFNRINCAFAGITTTSAALAATKGIKDRKNGEYKVRSLQEYHADITE